MYFCASSWKSKEKKGFVLIANEECILALFEFWLAELIATQNVIRFIHDVWYMLEQKFLYSGELGKLIVAHRLLVSV